MTEYSRLNAEIKQLKAERDRYVRHLEALDQQIAQKEREICPHAPVHSVPDDVLVEIFEAAYKHHFPHCRLDDGSLETHSPLNIIHVSQRWRKLALTVASIWTCIHVTPLRRVDYEEAIPFYLKMSRNLPLSIHFRVYGKGFDTRFNACIKAVYDWDSGVWAYFHRAWELLLVARDRWRHCAIHLLGPYHVRVLFQDLNGSTMPQLEYLSCSMGHFWTYSESLDDVTIGFSTPKLQILRLENLSGIMDNHNVRHLCYGLTELKLDFLGERDEEWHRQAVDPVLEMLRSASSSLRRLSLIGIWFVCSSNTAVLCQSLHFPLLEYLGIILVDVENQPPDCSIRLALCRAAGALQTLHLFIPTPLNPCYEAICSGQLILPSLRSLCMELPEDAEITTSDLIFAFPQLEVLQITYMNPYPLLDVIQALDNNSRVAWPRLRVLAVDDKKPLDEERIIAFAEHRVRVGAPLHTIVAIDSVFPLFKRIPEGGGVLDGLETRFIRDSESKETDFDGLKMKWWNTEMNAPDFTPWKGSFDFYDEFSCTTG